MARIQQLILWIANLKKTQSTVLIIYRSSTVFIHQTTFSGSKDVIYIREYSTVNILNCKFHIFQFRPLYFFNKSKILIHQTIFSDWKNSISTLENSKIVIFNCHFRNNQSGSLSFRRLSTASILFCYFINCQQIIEMIDCDSINLNYNFFDSSKRCFLITNSHNSILQNISFKNCQRSISIFGDSTTFLNFLHFINVNIGIECFPNWSLGLVSFYSNNSFFGPKPFCRTKIEKGDLKGFLFMKKSSVESNDLLIKSYIQKSLVRCINYKIEIPSICTFCQKSNQLSCFSRCNHSIYCWDCFSSNFLH